MALLLPYEVLKWFYGDDEEWYGLIGTAQQKKKGVTGVVKKQAV